VTTKTSAARTYAAIFALLAIGALFAALGTWQLRRAEMSRAVHAQFDSGATETVLETLPASLDEAHRFRRLEVRGAYVDQPQFLLDNMLYEGVAGYHVLTALKVAGRRERVLVNRGWVPAGRDRQVLPDVAIDSEMRTVVGRLERLPRPGMRLGAEDASGGRGAATVVLQYPTADELAGRLDEPVHDYQLLLDPSAADGYVRAWQAPGVAPERNLAYAGQWFALAAGAAAAALVMAFRTVRRRP
jgi:surfeit locus 1 family protein